LICHLDFPDEIDELTPIVEHHIYRIFQEVLTNIERHAGASKINFSARREENRLEFSLQDNGRGFDTQQATLNGHYGVRGMKERADLIGAELTIDSTPGGGTRLILNIKAEL